MANARFQALSLEPHLRRCGYSEGLLRAGYRFGAGEGAREVQLAAFAHVPADARSACIAVVDTDDSSPEFIARYRDLGAPLVFACKRGHLELWKQRVEAPQLLEQIPADSVDRFFSSRADRLAPESIYRAKTRARFEGAYQLDFVDAGLVPVLESEIGERLSRLIEACVLDAKGIMRAAMTPERGAWLLREVFWLLAAKILRDKEVPSFKTLDLSELDDVRARVARHYGKTAVPLLGTQDRETLSAAARRIEKFSHLGQVTTESLAHVYEDALVSRETRSKLGTHSTPSYLVDYVVSRLARWIGDIPPEDRRVLEPACGHAAFLVAAMRLLRDLLPRGTTESDRKSYLRSHLTGIETDPLAREIARLSLTLADIPNPNGWQLVGADMFQEDTLQRAAGRATILLSNPPYEDFSRHELSEYARQDIRLKYRNKAAETLSRMLPQVRPGSVFGIVVQQNLLHAREYADLREALTTEFELLEVCLLPDRVFSFADHEAAVILGRRAIALDHSKVSVTYKRVREHGIQLFETSYRATSGRVVPQTRFAADSSFSLRLPDLEEVWRHRPLPPLDTIASVQKGLEYKNSEERRGRETSATRRFAGAVPGFESVDSDLLISGEPRQTWMSVAREVVRRTGAGTTTGVPQVLLNYAPVSRGPWRAKAVLDAQGHAITSRFLAVRPRTAEIPLEYLWALLNSPYANAYLFSHTSKRDHLPNIVKSMPVPRAQRDDMERIAGLVQRFLRLSAEQTASSPERIDAKPVLLSIDAEVLRLYGLAPRVERAVLDIFDGYQRAGVGFEFTRYYPPGFESAVPLRVFLSGPYRRATASNLQQRARDEVPPGFVAALATAVDAFKE